ncbi:pentatricopeptide repeat-containing protein At1g77360, mitochondrial-like [Prosopis cineraria]|uniref:pentatricopeptide repeat-containing protein At1g77360, mitochondrial-like n=1 Tax=Prosopis cineraria TaxID=364024 RepID=UPI00240FC0E2|nr:pentatricopeptide repeat-containing protein At1g77360, mitochondrial-like [Prosopis cineraria]XP_054808162.1 pentatricopeptide repeat-containing protein At1g77360, mitochondrial-like [Prosopis cineraria]
MAGNLRNSRLRNPPDIISSENPKHSSPIPKSHEPNQFPSHLDAPEVSSSARTICNVLTRVSPNNIESTLSSTGIEPSANTVQEVLKLSYNYPSSAVKFFRWAGQLKKHTAHAWNLMVDLLGKNQLFEPMWDAIRSMNQEGALSMSTFVSVFESYCMASRFNEAVMSFDVMDRYGIQQDVVAVNSLLSAMCREDNQTSKAMEFFEKIKEEIPPDGDTFCILLEGWEKEGNLAKAKTVFDEMIVRVGWSPTNMSAYDTFLTTLVRGLQIDEAMKFLKVMKEHDCLPSLKFFTDALDILTKQNDAARAILLWNIMVDGGLLPTLIMYNAMIGLVCSNNEIGHAYQLLDEMVFYGAFPDSLTYNMIFECLVKNKKVRQAERFFTEMIKNECPPTHSNCAAAITMFFNCDDPEAANEIWSYMVDNHVKPLDDSANALLLGLCSLDRLSELKGSAEDMLERKVNIYESTMRRLQDAFYKEGRSGRDRYDHLYKRRRARILV